VGHDLVLDPDPVRGVGEGGAQHRGRRLAAGAGQGDRADVGRRPVEDRRDQTLRGLHRVPARAVVHVEDGLAARKRGQDRLASRRAEVEPEDRGLALGPGRRRGGLEASDPVRDLRRCRETAEASRLRPDQRFGVGGKRLQRSGGELFRGQQRGADRLEVERIPGHARAVAHRVAQGVDE
jgi:hypothetical protein